jgi:predicted transcriptional regulator
VVLRLISLLHAVDNGVNVRFKGAIPIAVAFVARVKEVSPVGPPVMDGRTGDFEDGRYFEMMRRYLGVHCGIEPH